MKRFTVYKIILYAVIFALALCFPHGLQQVCAAETQEMTPEEIAADQKAKVDGIKLLIKHGNQLLQYNTVADNAAKTALSDYIQSVSSVNFKKEPYENVVFVYETLKDYIAALSFTDNIVANVFISTAKDNGIKLEKYQGYQKAAVTVFRKDGTAIATDDLAKIKVRGNNTSNLSKRPYTIKFDKRVELIEGAGREKRWVLLAEANDKTLLRNALMFDLAKTMEIAYVSEHEYARVYVDGEYRGVYLLTEPVEAKEHRVDIDTENGDFLVDLNAFRKNGTGYVKPDPDSDLRFEIKEPDERTDEEFNAISDTLTNIYSVVKENIGQPGGFDKVREVADVESIAKMYLLLEFTKSTDINKFSVFFYYKDGKLYCGPAWDFDQALGNVHRDSDPGYWKKIDGVWVGWLDIYGTGPAFSYFKQYDEFNDLVKKYFAEYSPAIKNIINGTAEDAGSIAYYRAIYGDVFATNFRSTEKGGAGWDIWVTSWRAYKSLNTYEESIEYLIYWIQNRYDWLYEYWEIQTADEPEVFEDLIFDGTEIVGVQGGIGFTLEGATATEAGTYTATATLEPGYIWPDGSGKSIELTWKISAPAPTATPEPTETPTPLPTHTPVPTNTPVPEQKPEDTPDLIEKYLQGENRVAAFVLLGALAAFVAIRLVLRISRLKKMNKTDETRNDET